MKRYWHWSLGEIYWRNAAQIVATSEMEQQELVEDGVSGEKIVIRYNGIERCESADRPQHGAFRAKWGIPLEEPLVLFLGRLIPRKGADILIKAFSEACPKSGRLVIAGPEGEPGYRATLEQRAREAGIESRVIFTGALYDHDKSALMMDTNIFVLPSRYENFANSAAEAIACDIPVIVTDSCGICSLVKGRAGLVIAPEEQQLVAALRNLISDRVLYAKLKAGCREVAAELSWDRLTEQMEGHYARVLKHSHGHL
jgi:glycosyltransferase involved in cell wall biosynthesis